MTPSIQKSGLFLTSAKSIQRYVLATDTLKDMLGASSIIRRLPEELLPAAIDQLTKKKLLEGKSEKILSTAGRAAYFFHNLADAYELAKVWPLLAGKYAPGLELVQTVVECNRDEIPKIMLKAEELGLRSARQCLTAELPEPGPLVVRNRSTGLAAVSRGSDFPDSSLGRKNETLDQKAYKELIRPLLPEEFHEEINFGKDHFPLAFDDIATNENSYLAIIHIDANSLGEQQRRLIEEDADVEKLQKYYQTTWGCINASLRKAVLPIMQREKKQGGEILYPFRPIICSGDDITMVMRAADGIGFAKRFLEEFSVESGNKWEDLGLEEDKYFTACAGIAFVKKAFPFAIAYELCESLCSYAKEKTGRKKSAVAFHRVSASNTTTYPRVVRNELTVSPHVMTMNPYLVYPKVKENHQADDYLPLLDDLLALAGTMQKYPSSGLREIVQQMYVHPDRVASLLARMCKLSGGGGNLQDRLATITGSPAPGIWRVATSSTTPFADALEMLAMDILAGVQDVAGKAEEEL